MKLPEVKAPQFLTDLVRDLRDRHLLPLIAVLLVAIVAVPVALSKSEPQPSSPAGKGSFSGSNVAVSASHLTVVPDNPGLRDYRRRLHNLHAKDPFTPHSPAGSQTSSTQSSTSASTSATTSTSSSSGSTTATVNNGSTTSGSSNTVVRTQLKYFSYAIDVRTVPVSGGGEPSVRRNLPTLTKLPSRKVPAVVYMGVSADAKKAILLISSNVTSITGSAGVCVLGSPVACQLLALKPGSPETFVYGANDATFRIELLKAHLVVTNRLNRAPLGAPHSGN